MEQSAAGDLPAKRARLGVLFVHGIGDQREGETLAAFSEPLIDWIRAWALGRGALGFSEPLAQKHRDWLELRHIERPDGVDVEHASLLPSRRLSGEPAHSIVDLRFKPSGEGMSQRRQRWLLAESWWGEQMQAPSVFDLLRWLFSRGPWIALAHACERALQFQRRGAAWRRVGWLWAVLRFAVAATIVQMALVLSWIVALVPLPVVRRYVLLALQRVTLILGDSYGLVANETQRGAILSRFEETVRWMRDRCDELVIVAHSQGAAVVHAALEARRIVPPGQIVTFGAGIAKLSQLRLCEVHRRWRLIGTGWIMPTVLAAALLALWLSVGDVPYPWLIRGVAGALAIGALACAVGAFSAWRETRVHTAPAPPLASPGWWLDLFASADPVPQGPLNEHLPLWQIESRRIINRRSILTDHTTYWHNKASFISPLVAALDRHAGMLDIPDLDQEEDFTRAQRHQEAAMAVLSTGWWLTVATLAWFAVKRRERLADAGKAVIDQLAQTPASRVANWLEMPGASLAWFVHALTGAQPSWPRNAGHAVVAGAGLVLAAYLWWTIASALLVRWANAQVADFVSQDNVWGRYGTWLVWPFVAYTLVAPLVFLYAAAAGHNPWVFSLLPPALLLALLFAGAGILVVWEQIPRSREDARRLLAGVVALAADAVTPGSDQSSIGRHGIAAWKALATCWVVVIVCAAAVGSFVPREADAAFEIGVLAGLCLVALALAVRLWRLVRQRGRPLPLAAALVAAPLLLPALLVATRAPARSGFFEMLASYGLVVLVFTAPVYFAVDRWLAAARGPRGPGANVVSSAVGPEARAGE